MSFILTSEAFSNIKYIFFHHEDEMVFFDQIYFPWLSTFLKFNELFTGFKVFEILVEIVCSAGDLMRLREDV